MYCFRCGIEMSEIAGVLTCVPGKMPLSRRLQTALMTRFASQQKRASDVKLGKQFGLFCPGCGIPMDGTSCRQCSQSLRDLLFDIVELHPHE
jgi:hypothetical protein